jgi:small subunit ribosomal protein S9
VPEQGVFLGTGRRKTAVARVRIKPGTGKILINKRELNTFFPEEVDRNAVMAPLNAVGVAGRFDVSVNVNGGGHTGQAGAVLLGLSRALVQADEKAEGPLRDGNYLTRDARKVERKKYGRRKARRRFQFSKR